MRQLRGFLRGTRAVVGSRAVHLSGPALVGVMVVSAIAACSSSDETPDADAGAGDSGPRVEQPAPDAGIVDAAHEADAPAAPVCDSDGGVPEDFACAGLYTNVAAKTLAPGVRAYTPGLTFWSDGAEKSRWIYLPPNTKIDTSDMDSWVFPVGTKAFKEFKLGGKRIETRVYWKRSETEWSGATYQWNPDETAAVRLRGGLQLVNGTPYEIPAEVTCGDCHLGSKDKLLGFDAVGLGNPAATGVTLALLKSGFDAVGDAGASDASAADGGAAKGLLTAPPAKTTIAVPEDATGKSAAAVGYLHANCGLACHNALPDSGASFTKLYMRLSAKQLLGATPVKVKDLDAFALTVNVAPTSVPRDGFFRIKPKDVPHSLVHYLASGADQAKPMPPFNVHTPDPNGIAALAAWITAMPLTGGGQ